MSLLRKLGEILGIHRSTREPGIQVVDLWSAEDRAIAAQAQAGTLPGDENRPLVEELIELGRRDELILQDEHGTNSYSPRAQEIGRILSSRGGKPLMKAAYYQLQAHCGPGRASHLDYVWNGIGGWMA